MLPITSIELKYQTYNVSLRSLRSLVQCRKNISDENFRIKLYTRDAFTKSLWYFLVYSQILSWRKCLFQKILTYTVKWTQLDLKLASGAAINRESALSLTLFIVANQCQCYLHEQSRMCDWNLIMQGRSQGVPLPHINFAWSPKIFQVSFWKSYTDHWQLPLLQNWPLQWPPKWKCLTPPL